MLYYCILLQLLISFPHDLKTVIEALGFAGLLFPL